METRKIAIACFVGGALCCAVALIVARSFWWFGLIAGFAGGYISYEFREVCRNVPIALKRAGENVFGGAAGNWIRFKSFFLKPHPFLYSTILMYVVFMAIFGKAFAESLTRYAVCCGYSHGDILVFFPFTNADCDVCRCVYRNRY